MSTIDGLASCTNYSIEIGAGPYIYRQKDPNNYSIYADEDQNQENNLLETINTIWSSQENSFKSFASTIPVSFLGIINSLYLVTDNVPNIICALDLCIN